jgi:hypothetical protein
LDRRLHPDRRTWRPEDRTPGATSVPARKSYLDSTARRCVTERRHPDVDRKPTALGEFVFVGANAVVQMGCTIGDHSIIGAGAVVLEDTVVPPYSLVVGVPARVVRDLRRNFAVEQFPRNPMSLAVPKLSVVVAAFNEEGNLPPLYQRVLALDWTAIGMEPEFVFVDDHSRDRTPEILRELAARDPR